MLIIYILKFCSPQLSGLVYVYVYIYIYLLLSLLFSPEIKKSEIFSNFSESLLKFESLVNL